jgi:hypothetical protein
VAKARLAGTINCGMAAILLGQRSVTNESKNKARVEKPPRGRVPNRHIEVGHKFCRYPQSHIETQPPIRFSAWSLYRARLFLSFAGYGARLSVRIAGSSMSEKTQSLVLDSIRYWYSCG